MMALGLSGTLAVMAKLLPAPLLAPPQPAASIFANDFVGRDQLLIAYQWIRLHVLRSVPPSVVIGRHGWLYYRSEAAGDGWTLYDFMGSGTPDPGSLAKWKKTIVDRRLDLEARGIRYLAFVAPNQASIYPENLPREIRNKKGSTRLDAIIAAMPSEVLDLRPVLIARKSVENVYDSSDTHWNDVGAFVAYQAVTARLAMWFSNITPMHRSDFRERALPRTREIEAMIGAWAGTPQPSVYLDPLKSFAAHCAESGERVLAPGMMRDPNEPRSAPNDWTPRNWIWKNGRCPSGRFVQDNPALPKGVVFYDSFMIALNPFLSQNFREVLYVRNPFDPSTVAREQPDVVIQEVTERYAPLLF